MGAGGGMGGQPEAPSVDTAETVHISSLALLKMLKHGACLDCCVLGVVIEANRNSVAQAARACPWK